MLKEIAHLNDAELQSLVLWNRLLVYAALYGVADQVTKGHETSEYSFRKSSLKRLRLPPFYHDVTHSSHAMSTYGSTASTASHFTVSSGSGGGFSGGGGGGRLWRLLSSAKNGLGLFPSSLEAWSSP